MSFSRKGWSCCKGVSSHRVGYDPAMTSASELRRRLNDRGWALARIDGVSMQPTLFHGDTVRVEIPQLLRPGDIVTFELRGRLYTHRVARLVGDTVFCRGDNRIAGDPGVSRSKVIGLVTEVIGRGSLSRAHSTLSLIGLRRSMRRGLTGTLHLAAELKLLGQQMTGRTPASLAPSLWGAPTLELSSASLVIGPEHLGVDPVAPPGRCVDRAVIPAGIYSRLPYEGRLDLLRSVKADQLIVAALPREMMGWLPRQLGRLRSGAALVGLNFGRDGDAMVARGFGMPPGYVHYFGALDLSAELRGALPSKTVSVKRMADSSGPLLVGAARPRSPGSGSA